MHMRVALLILFPICINGILSTTCMCSVSEFLVYFATPKNKSQHIKISWVFFYLTKPQQTVESQITLF